MNRIRTAGFWRLCAILMMMSTGSLIAAASSAAAEVKTGAVLPDFVTAGKTMRIDANVLNIDQVPLEGTVIIKYEFPVGIEPGVPELQSSNLANFGCTINGQTAECTGDTTEGNRPGVQIRYVMVTPVAPDAAGTLTGSIEISGSALDETITEPFTVKVGPSGPFAIRSLDVTAHESAPFPASQAGAGLSQLDTTLRLLSEARSNFDNPGFNFTVTAPTESFRDVITHVPPGFLGDPGATGARCTFAQLTSPIPDSVIPTCPLASQVGLAEVGSYADIVPVYNLVPPNGYPAAFGFAYNSVIVTLLPTIRPDDHGIDLLVKRNVSSVPLARTEVTFWGVPADHSHDPLRGICLQSGFGYNGQKSCPFTGDREAFLRNPTSCTGPLPWSIEMDTYQHPGAFVRKETSTAAMEGCDVVPFDPSLSLAPSQRTPASPSGLDLELTMPQEGGPDGLAQADLRSVELQLPEGVAVNAPSADGLAACSDGQLRLGLEGPSACPDAARIGTLELTTPLLEEPVGGSVFLRSQASSDPESGELFRLALEIRSDRYGLGIKLPGSLVVDEETGTLTTRFSDLPQLPFESMQLHLKTGPRAPLRTPSTCGTYSARAVLEGWNGKTETAAPSFTIDQGCTPPPFEPGFEAGVSDSTAGEFAPFSLRVTRGAGQPNITRIDATLPEGELAKLAGVPVCSGAQASAGDCPPASRIGHVVAGIGEGSNPLYLPQAGKSPTSVYLAGPYKGAPYSILATVPAQAGPFDLGQVSVRSALRVDPVTAQASVLSDPLPQIFAGVPVSYRDVRVLVDRPGFTLNPTDCGAKQVRGTIASIGGQSAAVADRFQVADCAALGFKPRLSLRLRGKTKRSGNPALTAVLRMPAGGANIARAAVTLPGSEFIAQDHLDNVCTRTQYAAAGGGGAGCPKGSVYGRARAFTPLLDRPLEGPVYLRSNGGERELPDLVASLHGAIDVELVGYVDSDKRTGGLRTTFARVPDAPVSKFVLKMPAGEKSLLENSTNICRGKHRAIVKMDGQNGRVHDFRPLVRARCGKGARAQGR